MELLYLTSVDCLTKAPGMLVALRVLDYRTVSRARATPVLVSTFLNYWHVVIKSRCAWPQYMNHRLVHLRYP